MTEQKRGRGRPPGITKIRRNISLDLDLDREFSILCKKHGMKKSQVIEIAISKAMEEIEDGLKAQIDVEANF